MAARAAQFQDTVLLECVRSAWVPSTGAYLIAASCGISAAMVCGMVRWAALLAGILSCASVAIGRGVENLRFRVSDEVKEDMRATRVMLYVLSVSIAVSMAIGARSAALCFEFGLKQTAATEP